MSKKLSKRAKKLIINISVLVVLTGITLLILYFSYRDEDITFGQLFAALESYKAWSIVAAFGCMLLFILFEALSIMLITRRLGHKTKIAGAIAYSASDNYYSAITPSASGGQPASMFYMVRDGMSGGVAGFSLVFNLMAYTASIIIMGIFAFIAKPGLFSAAGWGAQVFIIVGFTLQIIVLGFFVMCVMWSKVILKMGNGVISLLAKMHIFKHADKWREKWKSGVDKYSASRHIINEHPTLFIWALLLNLLQRISQTLIPCFICYFAMPDKLSFLDIFVMQTFVVLGYNMMPLPGGVGVYEIVFAGTYGAHYSSAFLLPALLISRIISYYLSIIVCGIYTLIYHAVGLKGKKAEAPPPTGTWQYSMYSEGEEWCVGEQTLMSYAEGETSDGDSLVKNAQETFGIDNAAPDGAETPNNAENTENAVCIENAQDADNAAIEGTLDADKAESKASDESADASGNIGDASDAQGDGAKGG